MRHYTIWITGARMILSSRRREEGIRVRGEVQVCGNHDSQLHRGQPARRPVHHEAKMAGLLRRVQKDQVASCGAAEEVGLGTKYAVPASYGSAKNVE